VYSSLVPDDLFACMGLVVLTVKPEECGRAVRQREGREGSTCLGIADIVSAKSSSYRNRIDGVSRAASLPPLRFCGVTTATGLGVLGIGLSRQVASF
jgi:hypothetical protein